MDSLKPRRGGATLPRMEHPHILIAGCGDLGMALGRLLADQGIGVTGLRRSAVPVPEGMDLLQADVLVPDTLVRLSALKPQIVVYAVAADAQTDDSYRRHYVDGLANVLAALDHSALQHLFFVSSTRVYGRDDGTWVDETVPAVPADFGGERLLQGEALLAGKPATVLRLSGIYGPGRDRLIRLARTPAAWPAGNPWTNRIHRDDAAAFIALLANRRLQGEAVEDCYLVTDSAPAPQHEVLRWLASQQDIDSAGPAMPAAAGGKRLANARLLASGYALRYPDYRAGYGAELERLAEGTP